MGRGHQATGRYFAKGRCSILVRDPLAAQKFAESINGVTLETTNGGRVIDGWDEINNGSDWVKGTPPYGRDLWKGVSRQYAEAASGNINTVQSPWKLWDSDTLWHNTEKPIISKGIVTGKIGDINMYTINKSGNYIPLSDNYVDELLKLEGTLP